MPLHVAVICFVLISGYFHIKTSLRGLCKLVFPIIIIYLPFTAYDYFTGGGGLKDFLFFSQSPYWFIRAYAILFLMAPVINAYLTTNTRRIYFLIITGVLSIYLGLIREPSLAGGKNILFFSFLYGIGDFLRSNREKYNKVKTSTFVLSYILLNAFICTSYYLFENGIVNSVVWNLSFPYCSPLLVLNAALLFLIFSRISIKSKTINWLSASILTVYVIHQQPYILFKILQPAVQWIYGQSDSAVLILLYVSLFSFFVLILCLLVDKILKPLSDVICNLALRYDKKVLSKYQPEL